MFKRIVSFTSALVLSLSSLLVFAPSIVHAAAITWDGGGGDANFSTATNWVGDAAPIAGDSLIFPALGTIQSPVNDTTLTYSGITFSGATGTCASFPYAWYNVTGTQPLSISGNISNDMTGSCVATNMDLDITLTSSISVTGTAYTNFGYTVTGKTIALGANTMTFASPSFKRIHSNISGTTASSIVQSTTEGNLSGTNTSFAGSIVVNGGTLEISPAAFGTTAGGTTVNAGATVYTNLYKNTTLSEPFTLNGASSATNTPKLNIGISGDFTANTGDYDSNSLPKTIIGATYDGPLTLGTDASIGIYSYKTKLTIAGSISGSYKITRLDGEGGLLTLAASPNGSQTANGDINSARKDTVISADQVYGIYTAANSQTTVNAGITVTGNSTANATGILVVQGKIIGTVLAKDDSVVKGSGVIEGPLTLSERAKLAPGNSPGCLATGNLTFAEGTTYEFEVGGVTECTEYDQTKVTGTVTLGNGTLSVVRFNDFKPSKDQSYKIIDNDAADAVTGTFKDLAEGATFTVDGYVLKISYVGGDGNDVVLTVQSVPAVPDTGFKLLQSNPLLTLVSTTVLAGAMMLIAKKYGRSFNR